MGSNTSRQVVDSAETDGDHKRKEQSAKPVKPVSRASRETTLATQTSQKRATKEGRNSRQRKRKAQESAFENSTPSKKRSRKPAKAPESSISEPASTELKSTEVPLAPIEPRSVSYYQSPYVVPAPIATVFPPNATRTPMNFDRRPPAVPVERARRRVLFENPIPAVPPDREDDAYTVTRTPSTRLQYATSSLLVNGQSILAEEPQQVHPSDGEDADYDYVYTCRCGHKFVTKGNINRHLRALRFDEGHANYVHPDNVLFGHIYPRIRLKKREYEALRYKKQAEVDATTALAQLRRGTM